MLRVRLSFWMMLLGGAGFVVGALTKSYGWMSVSAAVFALGVVCFD